MLKGEPHPRQWSITHAPAVNTRATITRAAEAGRHHICTGVLGVLAAGTTAPTATTRIVRLCNGLSGGIPLLALSLGVRALIGASDGVLNVGGLHIAGSYEAAMTLEFDLAAGDNTFESVTLTGYTAGPSSPTQLFTSGVGGADGAGAVEGRS